MRRYAIFFFKQRLDVVLPARGDAVHKTGETAPDAPQQQQEKGENEHDAIGDAMPVMPRDAFIAGFRVPMSGVVSDGLMGHVRA